jgi:hypothetical protein
MGADHCLAAPGRFRPPCRPEHGRSASVASAVTKNEFEAVMACRDALVAHYRKVIAERGEASVFY